jgi:hypothetical protein
VKSVGIFIGAVFGLVLLALILYGSYFLFEYVSSQFGILEPQVKSLVIIFTGVIIFCAAIIAGGLKSSMPNYVSSERTNLYQRLLVFCSESLKQAADVDGIGKKVESSGLETQLALHGSPKVISTYMNLRRAINQEGKIADDANEMLKKLLIEMRRDVGRSDLNSNRNDLLDLLLGRH